MSNKKGRINIVYSTNPDFNYQYEEQEEQATLPPENKTCASPWTPNNGQAKS